MDLNVAVVAGKLAAEPELRQFESGSRLVRYLITIHSGEPRRRVDVLPVTLWDPPVELLETGRRGDGIWAACAVQRRFWEGGEGRRSTIELVAHHVELRPENESGGG